MLLLGGLASAEVAPPAPVVRDVPPGMEVEVQRRAEAEAPRPAAAYRGGFALRVTLGLGTYVEATGRGTETGNASTLALAIGGFPSRRVALYFQLEGTSGGGGGPSRDGGLDSSISDGLSFYGVSSDVFLTDRLVLGAGVGQAQTRTWSIDWFEERRGLGAHGRAGYVVWQRRKHALDVTGAVTTGRFGSLQVTTAGVQLGYRFL